jgi:hypothetical protein
MVLQPWDQQVPKDILLSIDERNIMSMRRRDHLALVDKDVDFLSACY